MRKTKIVCTLGPAVDDYKTLARLCKAGMNVARFNFSHGDYEEQEKRIETFKSVREDLGLPIPMMLDTKGPEIRIGKFENNEIILQEGNIFTLMHEECLGNESMVYVNYAQLYEDVTIGSRILVNDGLIELEVLEIQNKNITCKVLNGGKLSNKKSINVPGLVLNLPLLSEKDKNDIIFGIEHGFDIIAASFIRKPEDILAIREVLKEHNAENIKIIAKIENNEGVANFDKILEVADGIMVARGDLSVEIPMQKVPMLQKEFIKKCMNSAKQVIVATQMLESMITNPRPTRAEVSDIANAVLDGTSAIMLSGETATGKYPIECVTTMGQVAQSIENEMDQWKILQTSKRASDLTGNKQDLIIGHALCEVAMQTKASTIFSLSAHGNTPKALSSFRPGCNIIALTPEPQTARQMNLTWGVIPMYIERTANPTEMILKAIEIAKDEGYVQEGEIAVIGGSDTYDYNNQTAYNAYKTLGGICKI
ncbi:MAG: pyruvate kinase [Clostridia bacterium]|nr:pyruvate kinase [Clostridia bacterium]